MAHKIISEEEKKKILEKVQREFPSCSSLQQIHFYRYIKELEQSKMTPEERLIDDKKRAYKARKQLGLIK